MSDDSLWDEERANRYLRLYKDPRAKEGSQSTLCKNAAGLIKGHSVLDFGCGMGHIMPYLEFPDEYVGLDYSKTMLDYLENFFPGSVTIHADAAQPTIKLIKTLESQHLPIRYHTTISTSLVIHLPTIKMVENLLRNMWELSEKRMVFGVETVGDKKSTRSDGLTLRNISIENVEKILKDLGIPESSIKYTHQKITYHQYYSVLPLELTPFRMDPPQLYTRTTFFIIDK